MSTDSTQRTLCLLIKDDRVLLSKKKKGRFGEDKYNGFGGKPEPEDENIEATAIRELEEEIGVRTQIAYLQKRGELSFTFPHKPSSNQVVHVYIVTQWEGEPRESEEMMKPEWFAINNVPYREMWEADTHWIPHVLKGEYVTARFVYGEGNKLVSHEVSTTTNI